MHREEEIVRGYAVELKGSDRSMLDKEALSIS